MSETTDRDLAEQAMEMVTDEQGYDQFSIILCPVCNEPMFADDIDPNQFVGPDREAWQISPQKILERQPDNAWDRICVEPTEVETMDGDRLEVRVHPHDFTMDVYQVWEEKLNSLKTVERRKDENRGLGDYA